MKKIGLALGGGGARGFAHIGIIRAFENAKVPVHCICGTSMGAIVGAAYAVDPDSRRLERNIREVMHSELFAKMKFDVLKDNGKEKKGLLHKTKNFIRSSFIHIVEETKVSLIGLDKLEEVINFLIPDTEITETKIRFSCVATNLTLGGEKVFSKGSLRQAVLASASIPGVFPPVLIDGVYCADGGHVNNTPISGVKALGAEYSVACEVKSAPQPYERFEKARDVLFRAEYLAGLALHSLQMKEADMVISPPIKHLHWTDFDKIDMIIAKAEKEAAQKILGLRTESTAAALLRKIGRIFSLKNR